MLQIEEQKLWRDVKSQFYQDCKLLVENSRTNSAMLLICSFIDIVSSFYTGRVEDRGVANSFRKFVEDYMPIYCRTKFGDLLFSDQNRRVRDLGDVIYYCYRNGTTHEGILPEGIELFEDTNAGHVGGFGAIGWVKLNIFAVFNIVLSGIEKYETDLDASPQLQANFSNRYQYLKRQRFKKEV